MNHPHVNRREIETLAEMASSNWDEVPRTQRAARQAMKMKAALEMVLMFHSGERWSNESAAKWMVLQRAAGMDGEDINEEVTTKVLCNTVREVLGHL